MGYPSIIQYLYVYTATFFIYIYCMHVNVEFSSINNKTSTLYESAWQSPLLSAARSAPYFSNHSVNTHPSFTISIQNLMLLCIEHRRSALQSFQERRSRQNAQNKFNKYMFRFNMLSRFILRQIRLVWDWSGNMKTSHHLICSRTSNYRSIFSSKTIYLKA